MNQTYDVDVRHHLFYTLLWSPKFYLFYENVEIHNDTYIWCIFSLKPGSHRFRNSLVHKMRFFSEDNTMAPYISYPRSLPPFHGPSPIFKSFNHGTNSLGQTENNYYINERQNSGKQNRLFTPRFPTQCWFKIVLYP